MARPNEDTTRSRDRAHGTGGERRSALIANGTIVLAIVLALAAGAAAVARDTGNGQKEGQVPVGSKAPLPARGTYTIDPPHTFAYFAAQHRVVGRVRGRFDKMRGTVSVADNPAASRVDVSIEASSISTQNGMRDNDLRGPDFFDAAKFPVIEYHGRGARRSGDGWVVDGDLTIRGTTRPVPLWFTFKGTAPAQAGKPGRIAFHGTAAVKRADFGMIRELLDEIGVASASPDVWIEIDAELLADAQETPAKR